jgi:putative flavoprotein involved in K+ transport
MGIPPDAGGLPPYLASGAPLKEADMTQQRIETLIVGAGQAGLATGYHLNRKGREFLVVDGNDRVGDNWRRHYDSLRLYTPAQYCSLPGMAFPAEKHSFPSKDEVADFLETYALRFNLPVRLRTRIDRLTADPDGGFVAHIGPDTIHCDNVVIATGGFGRTPAVPAFADRLDPRIRQLHSSDYKRPSQLAEGPTLVVGASHSGCDLAYEIAPTHPTTLVGRDCGEIPVEWGSRKLKLVMPILVQVWKHVLTRRTPIGRKEMDEVRNHGGPMLRVKRHHLDERGVVRIEQRVEGVADGKPMLADGQVLDVANVIWCTGFKQVYDWVELPMLGEDGWPAEYRGVVESVPGLFFCGLAFQYAFSSMVFPGVGRDAAYVVDKIVSRAAARRTQAVPVG